MLDSEHEQLQQPDFPAFPVVFQPEYQSQLQAFESTSQLESKVKQNHNNSHLPEKQISFLQDLIQTNHSQIKYPHLFTESLENRTYVVENFFDKYVPLDPNFVSEIKLKLQSLNIIRLGQNKVYIGELQNNTCHGKGILIFKNGNVYEGQFENNKRSGKGFYIQHNIGFYKGSFNKDLKHGDGTQIYYKKAAYKGKFVDGLRHASGKEKGLFIDIVENNIYYGGWKLGIIHGKGTLKSNNSIYTGNFVNSLKHGLGQERFKNKDIYKGEYQNGRFDGNGTYCWNDYEGSDATYQGAFRNGLRHGKGKWSSNNTKYSGSYSENLKQGYGQLYFSSGNFYKGNFVLDKRQGYGEMFWNDGSFYKGQWKNGIQHGKGQIYMTGGQVVSGLFENSILVQVLPSVYEKQMQLNNLNINDLFGAKQRMQISTQQKQRTYSQHKSIHHHKKKLNKIQRIQQKGHRRKSVANNGVLRSKLYFKSPEHSESHEKDGRQCKCVRRLQNFRLRQRKKTKLNESSVRGGLSQY